MAYIQQVVVVRSVKDAQTDQDMAIVAVKVIGPNGPVAKDCAELKWPPSPFSRVRAMLT